MTTFGLEDLKRLLTSDSNTGDGSEITESSLTDEFTELGYDSLALLELVSKVEREFGIKLPDDALENMLTPKSTVDYISARIAEGGEPHMTGHTDNEVFIKAPIKYVWDRTNDIENWPNLFSEYSAAEILEREGGTIRFRLALHPDENGKVWSWVSARTPDEPTWTVRSQRVETGPFKYMWIFWEYHEENGGHECVGCRTEMKPDAPVNDATMQERLNRNTRIQQQLIKEKIETAFAETSTAH